MPSFIAYASTSVYYSYFIYKQIEDGATPHMADMIQNWLRAQFGKYFVDKKKWPPLSPDLNLKSNLNLFFMDRSGNLVG
jgi:hypothetical protein